VALLALPVALVMGAVFALAVLLDSPGPILYRSRRVGRGGRGFDMLKFRTMRCDLSGPPLSARDDVRYTRVGRWLSAKRFDELPQLVNVLRGDMRLVGPRPEVEEFVAHYPEEYARILSVPPGLTGPAQLAYADEGLLLAEVDDRIHYYRHEILPLKIEIDLAYVRRHGVRGDVVFLLRTALLPLTRLVLRLRGLAIRRRTPMPAAVPSSVALLVAAVAFVVLFTISAMATA
jgi:lipopolysaccharide/colanic/teichoic acid biosynthesis glycosyltransferase